MRDRDGPQWHRLMAAVPSSLALVTLLSHLLSQLPILGNCIAVTECCQHLANPRWPTVLPWMNFIRCLLALESTHMRPCLS